MTEKQKLAEALQMVKANFQIRDRIPMSQIGENLAAIELVEKAARAHLTALKARDNGEALEVFDAMIKYGEHQMECSFEELLNNMKVKEAKQTIRAALATPVGWRPIETAPREQTVMVWWKNQCWWGRKCPTKKVGCFYHAPCDWFVLFGDGQKEAVPTHWMPLPAAPKMED